MSRAKGENQQEDATPITHGKLRVLVDTRYACQKHRIKAGNRIWALQDRLGLPEDDMRPLHDFVDERMIEMETYLESLIKKEIKGLPIWEQWLKNVRGIGPCFAGGLIAWIGDPGRFETPSALWKYSGQHVVNGKAPTKKRGEKIDWNPALKSLCWNIGKSFVKCGDGYRSLYDQFKTTYEISHGPSNIDRLHSHRGADKPHPVGEVHEGGDKKIDGHTTLEWHQFDVSPGHIDAMTRRKTIKIFLSHLWQRWREIKGLPTRKAYVIEKLGHTGVIEPCEV